MPWPTCPGQFALPIVSPNIHGDSSIFHPNRRQRAKTWSQPRKMNEDCVANILRISTLHRPTRRNSNNPYPALRRIYNIIALMNTSSRFHRPDQHRSNMPMTELTHNILLTQRHIESMLQSFAVLPHTDSADLLQHVCRELHSDADKQSGHAQADFMFCLYLARDARSADRVGWQHHHKGLWMWMCCVWPHRSKQWW